MGLFSKLFGGGKTPGDAAREEAIAAIRRIQVPNPEAMYANIESLVQQGVITPEELDTFLLGDSAFEEIEIDPQYLEAQVNSLNKLRGIIEAGGLDAIDKAKIRAIQDELRTTSRGNILAIRQSARERGVGGSDFELVSQQLATQSAANIASREGTDVAAQAEQRRLDAIKAQAGLGGQLQAQAYGEEAEKARATDVIEAFNVSGKQRTEAANVAAQNVAQEQNLREKQRVSDINVAGRNVEQIRRAGLLQQDFQNRLNKAMGVAGQLQAKGAAQDDAAKRKAAMEMGGWSALIGAGATLGAGALAKPAVAAPSDIRLKEDIKPADAELDLFISKLDPSSFEYKDKKYGEGERFGIMAQDAEKSDVGQSIVLDTPEGKMLDEKATLSALLAAVSRLGKRVEDIEETE